MAEFVDLESAKAAKGMRLVVVAGVPSPWSQAAKGILHVKEIPHVLVRMAPGDEALGEWTGEMSAPVAIYEDEAPRSGWAEILLLAERLAPEVPLLPKDAKQRALCFGLSHELNGEMGLGWCRRLEGIAASIASEGKEGFPLPVAHYLGAKYGYREGCGSEARQRVVEILQMLTRHLKDQQAAGSEYYLDNMLSALDLYSATMMALFEPLPQEQCPMPEALRAAFSSVHPEIRAALDPILFEHRDRIYGKHLLLPVEL